MVALIFIAHICSPLNVTKHLYLLETCFLGLSTVLVMAWNLLLDSPFGLPLVPALSLKRLYSANLWITVNIHPSDPPALSLLCVPNLKWCINEPRNNPLRRYLISNARFRSPPDLGLYRLLILGFSRQTWRNLCCPSCPLVLVSRLRLLVRLFSNLMMLWRKLALAGLLLFTWDWKHLLLLLVSLSRQSCHFLRRWLSRTDFVHPGHQLALPRCPTMKNLPQSLPAKLPRRSAWRTRGFANQLDLRLLDTVTQRS